MRENRTYGLMRGRTYPMRGVPLYSTCRSEYVILLARFSAAGGAENRGVFAALFAALYFAGQGVVYFALKCKSA